MYVFVICLVPSLLLWWNSHFFLSCPDESSLCLLKGGRISGFTMAHAELPVLHDAFTSTIASGCQKTSYIVQFLWRDLTSGFDLIGPYIPVPKSVDSNVKKEFFMLCLEKILCGFPKTTPPIDEEAADERARYSVDMLFTNPEHPMGNPMLAMLCPSHQVTSFFKILLLLLLLHVIHLRKVNSFEVNPFLHTQWVFSCFELFKFSGWFHDLLPVTIACQCWNFF